MSIKALYLDAKSYEAKFDRRLLEHLFTEGVINTAQFPDPMKVQEKGTPDMSVDVLGGDCIVDGDDAVDYAVVLMVADGTTNVVISAADPTNPRKDLIVARFYDDGTEPGSYAEISVVTGTAAASPSEPTMPDNAYNLALVDVAASASSITNANITDRRVMGTNNPVGEIKIWPAAAVPAGYLMCDGSAVSRSTYASLFLVIGTTYGVGDGSTTFNLPNLEGRIPVGYDSAQSEFDALGKTGGEKTHTTTIAEMPAHKHDWDYTTNGTMGGSDNLARATGGNVWTTGIANTGGGGAHNNLQPYIAMNYIIKV